MQNRLRVGIIFGGPSREREISFAGGRTVYDNLDKRLFDPVPLFMDAHRRLILLDWQFIYKGTIRDFWPPVEYYPENAGAYQLSEESLGDLSETSYKKLASTIGKPVGYDELHELIDVVFLALHGVGGEDGAIQGMLETLGIPYTGSGLTGSAIGMDKVLQKRLMEAGGFHCPPSFSIERGGWIRGAADAEALFNRASNELGIPLVVRGANQGSSIGITILHTATPDEFSEAVDKAFFRQKLDVDFVRALDPASRVSLLANITDLRHGIGFPMYADGNLLLQPSELEKYVLETNKPTVLLESLHTESRVVVEGFLEGTEVSTIVIRQDDGSALSLLPTEIVKGDELFDYRSKYLPGLSRKKTPADLPIDQLNAVRAETERLFDYFEFDTYARIDGFVSPEGRVTLNDPNTTSGMLPSSFFFHQAAEIGLTPSAFLTYILRTSLRERARRSTTPQHYHELSDQIDRKLESFIDQKEDRRKIAVLLGGYSSERHISVESGRNVFEKLASSGKYAPTAIFVDGDDNDHQLYQLPTNLLLKDNADDIRQGIRSTASTHPVTEQVRKKTRELVRHFSGQTPSYTSQQLSYEDLAENFDEVFIALHGRPGEDGQVQQKLEAVGLPYNGSDYDSSQITINKFDTLFRLREAGFPVTDQILVSNKDFKAAPDRTVKHIGDTLGYPMIVKPVDDGCSSAVQKIDSPADLHTFLTLLFGLYPDGKEMSLRAQLGIHPKDELPHKEVVLAERLIDRSDADLFMEITCGLLTEIDESGNVSYTIFEPSEALSTGEILTLEEKFLAGEGQNITPARFDQHGLNYEDVAQKVKKTLFDAATLLNVQGYARIDAFVRAWKDGRVETVVIEVNSLPGMTPATCIYHQAALAQLTPFGFIDRIQEFGRQRSSLQTAN